MKSVNVKGALLALTVLMQCHQAFAAFEYLEEYRCNQDKLADMNQVTVRDEFAWRCYPDIMSALDWQRQPGDNTHAFPDGKRVIYPVFGVRVAGGPATVVPGPATTNESCDFFIKKNPGQRVTIIGYCGLGCLTPDQLVEFGGGPMPIGSGGAKAQAKIWTVKAGSTVGAIGFQASPLRQIVSDAEPGNQDILIFKMASGVQLKVTTNHPLVNGEGQVQRADTFKAGDELIRADGQPETVAGIEKTSYFGKVYNIRMASSVLEDNIYVAQGYLSGSIGLQNEEVQQANRKLLRHGELLDMSDM